MTTKYKFNLQKVLDEHNINVYQLAKICGVARPTMYRMLKYPVKQVHISTLSEIALALGCEIGDLFELVEVNDEEE